MDSPLLLTTQQVQAKLGFGRSKVYELLAAGEIESVKVGRNRRIPSAALDEYVARLRADSGRSAA